MSEEISYIPHVAAILATSGAITAAAYYRKRIHDAASSQLTKWKGLEDQTPVGDKPRLVGIYSGIAELGRNLKSSDYKDARDAMGNIEGKLKEVIKREVADACLKSDSNSPNTFRPESNIGKLSDTADSLYYAKRRSGLFDATLYGNTPRAYLLKSLARYIWGIPRKAKELSLYFSPKSVADRDLKKELGLDSNRGDNGGTTPS